MTTRNLPSPSLLVIAMLLLAWSSSPTTASPEISMGTTIVALRTKQGVVVGADTRTSQGSMVSNRYADKLSMLYQNGPFSCVLCRSGSAADTQYLAEQARWEFQSRELRYHSKPSLNQIARWLRYVVMNGDYSASLLCVGYDDEDEGGGRIFSIAPTGALLPEPVYAAAGSGSTFIIGLMDSRLQQTGDLLDEDEAIEFVAHLIHQAIARDSGSGGAARIIVLNQQGSRYLVVRLPPIRSRVDANRSVQSSP